ncbi:hypothetical protein ElyMa_003066600, partial [Elysia marginata]
MSPDLSVVLFGWSGDMVALGNVLVGRQAFDENDIEEQQHNVSLEDGRKLNVTVPDYRLMDGNVGVTDIHTRDCHAVVHVAQITSNLSLWYPRLCDTTELGHVWQAIQRKGIFALTNVKTFTDDTAQRKGKIPGTFLDWMRTQTGRCRDLFQAVQERCLLFDTDLLKPGLVQQRQELVDMIDSRILGRSQYIDMKFTEIDKRSQELQNQLSSLKEKMTTEIRDLKRIIEPGLGDTEKRSEEMEKRISEPEREVSEGRTERTEDITPMKNGLNLLKESSIWDKAKSICLSYPRLKSRCNPSLLLVPTLILVIALFLKLYLWPVPTNQCKAITSLDKSQDLRRYVDVKFDQTAKRILEVEKQMAEIKILAQMRKENLENNFGTGSENLAK